MQTARQQPVLVAAGPQADHASAAERLEQAGCEVLVCSGSDANQRLRTLLLGAGQAANDQCVGRRGWPICWEACLIWGSIDEVHVFVAPKLVGGQTAPSPDGGRRAGADPRVAFFEATHVSKFSVRMFILRVVFIRAESERQ